MSFPGKCPGAGTRFELPSESWRTIGRDVEWTVGQKLWALTGKPKGEQGHEAKPDTSSSARQMGQAIGHSKEVVFVGLPSFQVDAWC